MEKLIIVAGSPNTGKTISTNLVIEKLVNKYYSVSYPNNDKKEFWVKNKGKTGGVVILSNNNIKIGVISFGDVVNEIAPVMEQVKKCDIVVCCSHATRGKNVFKYFHDYIDSNIDLSTTKIIPIYKNLLCDFENDSKENEYTSELIMDFIEKI